MGASTWAADAPGVLTLPDGRLVRGRGMRGPEPDGPRPEFGLYLRGRRPPATPWPSRWVVWPDFALPLRPRDARAALRELHERAATQRVEVGCGGGIGRTGTALACLGVLCGLDPAAAIDFVGAYYHPRAVETPWQRRWVHRFAE